MAKLRFAHLGSIHAAVARWSKIATRAIPAVVGIAILGVGWYVGANHTSPKKTNVPTHHISVSTKASPKPTQQPAPATHSSPATTPALAAKPAPVAKPAPKPAPVVKPAPQSSVSSLTPTGSQPSPAASSPSPQPAATATIVDYSSYNWSGYMADPNTSSTPTYTYTSISGSWVVPNATSGSSSTSADATWIGIGGVTNGDLIQTGTQNTVSNGKLYTSAFYEMLPAASVNISSMTVSPGDSMSASIVETAPSVWSLKIIDNTSGTSYSNTFSYASTKSSAEWIEEDPSYSNGSLVPLDVFSTVNFSGGATVVNGTNSTIANSATGDITMVSYSNQVEATPSALSGGSFSVSHN